MRTPASQPRDGLRAPSPQTRDGLSRRGFLKGAMAASAVALVSPAAAKKEARTNTSGDCGVASGDPRPDGVVIWTRVPDSYQVAGSLPVAWQVSRTPDFGASDVIASGTHTTSSDQDFTLSVKVEGLSSHTRYYYRFTTSSGYESVVGRTLTAHAEGDSPDGISFAFISCENYIQGYYNALAELAEEDVDFCVMLGDTIYEGGGVGVRTDYIGEIEPGRARTLNDFRDKHKLYMSDPRLQEVRRLFPWIYMWDDHEVYNNYAGADENNTEEDRELQHNGYQAFREYMPLDTDIVLEEQDGIPYMPLHRSFRFGTLMELFATDERQFREGEVCSRDFGFGCDAMYDDDRTMLGHAQAEWLKLGLMASPARWKFLMNEVVMMPLKLTRGVLPLFGSWEPIEDNEGFMINGDQWDGYPAEREAILRTIEDNFIQNVVVCTGDIHNCYAGVLRTDFSKARTPAVAVEIVGGSISSSGIGEYVGGRDLSELAYAALKGPNPHLLYLDAYYHVYTRVEVTRNDTVATYIAVDTVTEEDYTAFELARLTVPDGHAELTVEVLEG